MQSVCDNIAIKWDISYKITYLLGEREREDKKERETLVPKLDWLDLGIIFSLIISGFHPVN